MQAGALAAGLVLLPACGPSNSAGNTGNGAGNAPDNSPPDPMPERLKRLGVIVGGGAVPREGGGKDFFVGVVDLDAETPQVRPIKDIGFLGHGFTPRIDKPHLILVTEKHGPGCCEIDLKAGKVLRRITTVGDREFYGHSAFSPDGKLWYCTEANTGDGSYDGVLAVRDAHTMELHAQSFPTHGVSPHDCILIDDGATLVITNGGAPVGVDGSASVAYVDVKTGKAGRVLTFKSDRINAGHIAMTSRGELVCVSAPRDGIPATIEKQPNPEYVGAISFYDPKKDRFITADDPIRARMTSETLSVAIREETMLVGATNPAGDLVTFWDFHTGSLVKALENFKVPRGISLTLDGKYFAVTHDVQTHVTLIDAVTLEPQEQLVETSFISGSHNFVFNL